VVGVNIPVDDIGLLVNGICATLPEVGCLWSSVIMIDSDIACATILPDDVLIVKMTLEMSASMLNIAHVAKLTESRPFHFDVDNSKRPASVQSQSIDQSDRHALSQMSL